MFDRFFCRNKKERTLLTLITNAVLHGFSTPVNDFYLCDVLIKHMYEVMEYSLYKADAEEESEDSPKLDRKPGGGNTNEYTATQQKETLLRILRKLKLLFPQVEIVEHYQLSADV